MAAGCVLLDCSTVSPCWSAQAACTHKQLYSSSHCHLENVPLFPSVHITILQYAFALCFAKPAAFGENPRFNVLNFKELVSSAGALLFFDCCLWTFESVFRETRYFYACTDGSRAVGSMLFSSLFAWLSLSKTMRLYSSDDK